MDIQFICPGLFGPRDPAPGSLPSTPALDRLLARADGQETPPRDPLETLVGAFGLTPTVVSMPPTSAQDEPPPAAGPDHDLPTAALCLLSEAPDLAREGGWFHADPIHLRADRDQLLLFAGPAIAPSPDESADLVAAFNAHFAADGLHLIATRPDRWYLRVSQPPNLCTRPLHEVAGRAVDAYLPSGPDARVWNRWQNEAQMLFYGHPVNQAREAVGRPVISGVWTWGGGVLPAVSGGPALTIADHPLGIGLAHASGGARRGLDDLGQSGLCAGVGPRPASVLVFWDRLWWLALEEDEAAWCSALAPLETLAATLVSDLAAGRIDGLTLDDGARYRFTLTRAGLRRFWRRRGGLRAWSARRRDLTER